MSSNPTQPKFGDQGEGVSFPPEDDAEGHRFAANAEGEGFLARLGEGDGQPEGFRAAADVEDDTEGHRAIANADGPGTGPEGARTLTVDGGEDDTEGHRVSSHVDGAAGGETEGLRPLATSGSDEDDTEGHRVIGYGEGDGPEGVRSSH